MQFPEGMHPEMRQLIAARIPASADETIEQARDSWNVYSAVLSQPYPNDMEVYDRVVPTNDVEVPVRIYRPAGPTGAHPCLIYLHGGGFMKGDLDSSDTNAWGYAQETGAIVVSVDYRLSPENPHPAAFNDCYGVLCWLSGEGPTIGIDPGRIAIAGDSAGGSLTASVVLAARDRNGPAIAAQALIYPCTGTDLNTDSYTTFSDAPGLTKSSMAKYYTYLLSDERYRDDPYARPARAADFSSLPPAFVHPAGIDPLRDDGRQYAAKLALAGGEVTFREAKGMIHGFMRARLLGPASKAEFAAGCAFLRAHLFR